MQATERKLLNQMKIEFLSIPENVALARVVVASFAAQLDFTLTDLDEIKVAVSEAVSNAIIHGYENDSSKSVVVSATIEENRLNITVEDIGKGIADLEQALKPAFSTQPDRMGFGFVFMQSFMNDFKVETEIGAGTKVFMSKLLSDAFIDSDVENDLQLDM